MFLRFDQLYAKAVQDAFPSQELKEAEAQADAIVSSRGSLPLDWLYSSFLCLSFLLVTSPLDIRLCPKYLKNLWITSHYPPLLPPGQGSMTIFNVLFLILQSTSFDRIWPKVNLFWSDFGEKCIFRVF